MLWSFLWIIGKLSILLKQNIKKRKMSFSGRKSNFWKESPKLSKFTQKAHKAFLKNKICSSKWPSTSTKSKITEQLWLNMVKVWFHLKRPSLKQNKFCTNNYKSFSMLTKINLEDFTVSILKSLCKLKNYKTKSGKKIPFKSYQTSQMQIMWEASYWAMKKTPFKKPMTDNSKKFWDWLILKKSLETQSNYWRAQLRKVSNSKIKLSKLLIPFQEICLFSTSQRPKWKRSL